MASQQSQPDIKPATIFRHVYGVYPLMAMLAGMQLDFFSPLRDGPMTAADLAAAIGVRPEKLRPLLYTRVQANLSTVDGACRFGNTAEGDHYLVRGRSTYLRRVRA